MVDKKAHLGHDNDVGGPLNGNIFIAPRDSTKLNPPSAGRPTIREKRLQTSVFSLQLAKGLSISLCLGDLWSAIVKCLPLVYHTTPVVSTSVWDVVFRYFGFDNVIWGRYDGGKSARLTACVFQRHCSLRDHTLFVAKQTL